MLTEGDRLLLAPHLALTRSARAALTALQAAEIAADRRLAESTLGTTWQDRTLGGFFSRAPESVRGYHDARRAQAKAVAAVAEQRKEVARLERRVDGLIEPMMPRLDADFGRFAAAIGQCDRSLREVRVMRSRLDEAATAARTGTRLTPGDKEYRTAQNARRRYTTLVAEARNAEPAVRLALDAVTSRVSAAAGPRPALPWKAVLLDRLPPVAENVSALQKVAKARVQLTQLCSQLDGAAVKIIRWRSETEQARSRAVAAARDGLLSDRSR